MDRTKEEIFYLKYIYFLILIFVTIICHIYYINTKDYKIVTDDALFEAAKIGSNGFASEGLQNAQNIFESIYVKILSVFCIFFGNSVKTGLYLNAVIELCSVIVMYAMLLNLLNIKFSFIYSMTYSWMLLGMKRWSKVDNSCLFLFTLSLGLCIFLYMCKLFSNIIEKKINNRDNLVVSSGIEKIDNKNTVDGNEIDKEKNKIENDDTLVNTKRKLVESNVIYEDKEVLGEGTEDKIQEDINSSNIKIEFVEVAEDEKNHIERDYDANLCYKKGNENSEETKTDIKNKNKIGQIIRRLRNKSKSLKNSNDENETSITGESVKEKLDMREILPEDIEVKKTEFIENPLPLPKKKEHKKMDYAVELSLDNDDYDIVDMTGMDFYDIE